VAICAKNREEYFWEISDGEIAKKLWLESQRISKIVELDENIIMPNHVHGIITIDSDEEPVGTGMPVPYKTGANIRNYRVLLIHINLQSPIK